MLDWFNPQINKDLINKAELKSFSTEMRIQREDFITIRNQFHVEPKPAYQIDLDSYKLEKISSGDIIKVIENLHRVIVKEFLSNINQEFINIIGVKESE